LTFIIYANTSFPVAQMLDFELVQNQIEPFPAWRAVMQCFAFALSIEDLIHLLDGRG